MMHVKTSMSSTSDRKAAAAADPAAAQDQPAAAADPGQLLSLFRQLPQTTVVQIRHLWLRQMRKVLVCKVRLSCLVPASEYALCDDPGLPPQQPAPPSHL